MNRHRIFVIVTEAVALLLLAGMIVYLAVRWDSIPDTIPFHFNAAGAADGWGEKKKIIIMPVLAGLLYFMLTGVSALMNFASNFKAGNMPEAMLPAMKSMLKVQKIEVIILFFYITYCMAEANNMGSAFIYVILGVIIVTTAAFIFGSLVKYRR